MDWILEIWHGNGWARVLYNHFVQSFEELKQIYLNSISQSRIQGINMHMPLGQNTASTHRTKYVHQILIIYLRCNIRMTRLLERFKSIHVIPYTETILKIHTSGFCGITEHVLTTCGHDSRVELSGKPIGHTSVLECTQSAIQFYASFLDYPKSPIRWSCFFHCLIDPMIERPWITSKYQDVLDLHARGQENPTQNFNFNFIMFMQSLENWYRPDFHWRRDDFQQRI
jgi:hypothetical protein